MTRLIPRLLLLAGLLGSCLVSVEGRIGESRGELEGRLMSNRRAIVLEGGDKQMDRFLSRYENLQPLVTVIARIDSELPMRYELVRYFKKAEDDNIDRNEVENIADEAGWIIEVLYVSGDSVAEAYTRVGDAFSEFERNGLLILQGSNSGWAERASMDPEALLAIQPEDIPTVFKAEFVRNDRKVAATFSNGGILFYDTAFHLKLAKLDHKRKESGVGESLLGF